MNTYRTLVVGLGFASLASLVACGSSSQSAFGADPDFAAIESRFKSPTGTFDASKSSNTFAAYDAQRASANSNGSVVGGATGTAQGVSTKAAGVALRHARGLQLKKDDSSLGDSESCADLAAHKYSGSCACAKGGAYEYDFESLRELQGYKSGPIDVIMRVKFNACAQDATTVDGPLFLNMHADDEKAAGLRMLMDAHLAAKQAAETHKVDFTMLLEENKLWMSIGVDDGNIVIGATSDGAGSSSGSIVIRDKGHEYNCSFAGESGSCTREDGQKITVEGAVAAAKVDASLPVAKN